MRFASCFAAISGVCFAVQKARWQVHMASRQLPLIALKKTTLRLTADLHQRLKMQAVQERRQMADIASDAIEAYLSSKRASDKKS